MTALKNDQRKPPMELLPTLSLEEVAKVLAYGRDKYSIRDDSNNTIKTGAWNWAEGFEWGRLIGAANRHLGAFQRGEDLDPETNLSHIAHLACTSLFLLEHQLRGLGVDNRHKFGHNKTVETEKHSREIHGGFGTTTTVYSKGFSKE